MKTQSIYELIWSRAERSPESIALAAPGRLPLTYVELASQIRAVGRALHGLGIGPNDAVVIVLPHGSEIVTATLGVAAYATAVPLDPRSPAGAVNRAFASIEPHAVLVASGAPSEALHIAYALGIAVVEVESDRSMAGRINAVTATTDVSAVPLPSQGGDDAFMLPSWGLESHLALVSLTHHEVCSAGRELAATLELQQHDRCLNLTPLWKWQGSIADVIATLASGGTLACPPQFKEAMSFFEWVRECNPTWFTAEPQVHEAILAAANQNPGLLTHSGIRFVQAGDTKLPHELLCGIERTFDATVIEGGKAVTSGGSGGRR